MTDHTIYKFIEENFHIIGDSTWIINTYNDGTEYQFRLNGKTYFSRETIHKYSMSMSHRFGWITLSSKGLYEGEIDDVYKTLNRTLKINQLLYSS